MDVEEMMIDYYTLIEVSSYGNEWMPEGNFRKASLNSVRRAVSSGYLISRPGKHQITEYKITEAGRTRLKELEQNPHKIIKQAYNDLYIAWAKLINERGGMDADVVMLSRSMTILKSITSAKEEN